MAFNPYSPGTGVDHSFLITPIITNSAVISVGDAVKLDTSGFCTNATAGAPILGICVGFMNSSNAPIAPTQYSAGVATSTDVTKVTAASNNQTVSQQVALVETSKFKVWSAQVNGTVGTTAASGRLGAGIDVDSADTNYDRLLESTATRTQTTVTNFVTMGTDPNDSTRILCRLASQQMDRDQG